MGSSSNFCFLFPVYSGVGKKQTLFLRRECTQKIGKNVRTKYIAQEGIFLLPNVRTQKIGKNVRTKYIAQEGIFLLPFFG